jgi:hypothetical protein
MAISHGLTPSAASLRKTLRSVVVCPVECIDKDPAHPETEQQLLLKLLRLQEESA